MSPGEEQAEEKPEEGIEAYSGGGSKGKIVYRAMRKDPAGGPTVGPTARTLGVRPIVDIPVRSGQVRPNTGGMSVAPDRPENLHPLRRPPAYGGSGKDPVWCLRIDVLSPDLQFRQSSATHGLIEPMFTMAIADLQKALEATKPLWKELP